MTIALVTRAFLPLALLALLTACDRPKGPPPPKASAAAAAAAAPAPAAGTAAPGTVALSGTILEPQPNPAPARPVASAAGTSASGASTTSRSGGKGTYSSGVADDRLARQGAEPQALRDFQAEQERRDRELLDQDLSEAESRTRDGATDSDAYRLPREDGNWSASDELALEDEPPFEEPPFEEPPFEEPPFEEPPYDEPPYEDEPELDDRYDPRDGAYRP